MWSLARITTGPAPLVYAFLIGVTESAVDVIVCCVFRKDSGGLFEFSYYCLQHQQECSMTTLRYNVMKLKNLFTQYLRASNVISAFTVCSVDILGASIHHTALTGGILPLTELNLT